MDTADQRTSQPGDAPIPRAGLRLFLTSAAVLYTELVLLRWIPAMVTYVGFFANFLLVGCFLGMGCGILLGRRFRPTSVSPFALLLATVVLVVSRSALNFQGRTDDEIFFGLRESHAADVNFLVLPALVALSTLVMGALSLPLGPLLRALPPLRAYACDIAGSLAGILAFSALSILELGSWGGGAPPWVWFLGLDVILLAAWLAGERKARVGSLVNIAALALVLVFAQDRPREGELEIWSPYYRVTARLREGPMPWINVNGIPHQSMWPVKAVTNTGSPYQQIYDMTPGRRFERVLIVGAGSGTDVAFALQRDAGHIDAVEIDRVLARLGRGFHPDRPYDDPRVDLHIDDGRSYLGKSREKFDLIIFALPDSLTLASAMANLRLESFLFTREAFEQARDHLAPNGIFTLYNFYREQWLIDRLETLVHDAFGHPPQVRRTQDALAILAVGPGLPDGPATRAVDADGPTDDHPFLYLRHPRVPSMYLVALGCVIAFAVLAVGGSARVAGTKLRSLSPHFFALGAAFMVLETKSLVTFSLLFGTTWLVNSLAFFAILASVLAAILVNATVRIRPPWLYATLVLALALAWAVPPESLLVEPRSVRYLLASGIAFAPIFIANLIFSHSFRDSAEADVAFASNLLGAATGGAVEYLALVTGYRALALFALALYAVAFASRRREEAAGGTGTAPAPAVPASA